MISEEDGPHSSAALGAGFTYLAEAVDMTLGEAKAEKQTTFEERVLGAIESVNADGVTVKKLEWKPIESSSGTISAYEADGAGFTYVAEVPGNVTDEKMERAKNLQQTIFEERILDSIASWKA